jgi:hypothetical protein
VNEWLSEWKDGMQIEYLSDEERERDKYFSKISAKAD